MIDLQRRASCETSRLDYRLVINARLFVLRSFANTLLRDDDESVCAKSITREMGEQRQVKSIQGESHGAAFVRIVDAVTVPLACLSPCGNAQTKMRRHRISRATSEQRACLMAAHDVRSDDRALPTIPCPCSSLRPASSASFQIMILNSFYFICANHMVKGRFGVEGGIDRDGLAG